ncbi:hypothetical protein [Actinoplanes subtropicus]|uniref:hypothetical protein n=1 Tax=Actinoplanes subtropicus TaxID=543632 RepID=UPI0004C3EC38|nr:hypothetical protein [Actinoplanes subtropicus]
MRGGLIVPEELLLGMAALPAPAGLLVGLKPVKLTLLGLLQQKTLTVAAVTTVAVGGGLAYAVHEETLPPGGETVTVTPTLARSAAPGIAGRVATRRPRTTFPCGTFFACRSSPRRRSPRSGG